MGTREWAERMSSGSAVLRPWQSVFVSGHAAEPRPDFLLVATPGAGKTLAACHAARTTGD